MSAEDDYEEIQEIIGRALDPIELAIYPSLDAIPPSVRTVAVQIANSLRVVLACSYLHDRVPHSDPEEAKLKLDAIWDRAARKER